MITRTFKLCLNAGTGSAPYINVSQYDEGETWLFELYSETGERYIPTTGAIVGVKSDGHGIANTGTVDSEGRVVITETQQMTASAGRAIYELSIDGLTHGTANFIVAVERKPTDDAVMSDSDLSLIQEAIDSAEVIVEVIGDGDPSEVIGEHVDAWLDNHPEATTTVEDGAITAPKINQSLWDKLLVNEEASGAVASFDDGADDVPVSSLKVALEPIQTGSGDPSPSNIRPIIAANGKNLLQVTATTQTNNGITFTVNADKTVTANGTATAQSTFVVADFTGTNGTQYIVNGAPSGSTFGTYFLSATLAADYGSGATFTGTGASNSVRIIVQSGQTVNNLVFKPMIRLASITDSTFQPYQGIMVERKGVNQWDEQWELGGISNQNGTNYGASDRIRSKNYIPCLPNTTYYFKTPAIMGTVAFYNSSQTFISALSNFAGGTFTTPANTQYIRFCGTNAYGATYNKDISINYPSIITDYHASTGNSYPYTLGREVYGGTVDLATGVLTVTHVYYQGTFTTPTSKEQNRWAMGTSLPNVSSALFGKMWDATIHATDYGFVSDSLRIHLENAEVANASTCAFYGHGSSCEYRVRVPDTYTAAEAKAIADANHIVYPIEPQTIQLTPTEVKTLLGYNNISSTGTVDVIYHADTKLYVDKSTTVDNSVIAPTEADFVATRNYTVNDLLIVADTLYKVTANIASGSAITPNSNVQQTTLGALIKALS